MDLYERLTEELVTENIHPRGLIFHWVASVDASHIRITDVWESREALDEWGAATAETVQRHGVPQPIVELFEVSHYQSGADLRQRV
ncbi:MAG TPA: hypothetical protein VEQ66_09650 [Propionibacteriaceae bacterium]|nr:hypothetical protein [Propionibacteriaceae bacterium]